MSTMEVFGLLQLIWMSISETLLLFQLITTIVFGILGYIKK